MSNAILDFLFSQYPWVAAILITLGVLTFAKEAFKAAYVFLQIFVIPGKSLKTFGAGKGAWAVVTGASDGIGREFALQLAKVGFHIILVARNEKALTALAEEISQQNAGRIATKIVLLDFGLSTPVTTQAEADLTELSSTLDVSVLVNNVGKSHDMPTDFADTPSQEIQDIVKININGTLKMTSIFLPGMVAKKRGLILNMGSFAGEVPSPMLATYSGSKAFVATYTAALAAELKHLPNVVIQHLNTFFVVSKMSKIRKSSLLVPTPKQYVKSALGSIGQSCGAAFTGRPATSTPYWSHAIADWLIGVVAWKSVFVAYTLVLHKDIRRRALRKLERELKKA